jgi:hypothetical protein
MNWVKLARHIASRRSGLLSRSPAGVIAGRSLWESRAGPFDLPLALFF